MEGRGGRAQLSSCIDSSGGVRVQRRRRRGVLGSSSLKAARGEQESFPLDSAIRRISRRVRVRVSGKKMKVLLRVYWTHQRARIQGLSRCTRPKCPFFLPLDAFMWSKYAFTQMYICMCHFNAPSPDSQCPTLLYTQPS